MSSRAITKVLRTLRGRVTSFARRRWKAIVCATAVAAAAAAGILLWPMDVAPYLDVAASGEMLDRSGRPMYAFLNDVEQWCFPRELDAISPRLIEATIAVEDQRFYRHHGVDLLAAVRALIQNVQHRRTISGASTLTMQVVKKQNHRRRSLVSKALQAIRALRLEHRVTKQQILQAYLNRAPYGMNLVGCEAASRRFFGKPANELTLPEAALLAGLPKSPTRLMPLANPERALVRRNYVLARMLEEGFVGRDEYERACNAPIGVEWHAFPALSPHLALRRKPAIEAQGCFATTLDASMQTRVEQAMQEHIASLRGEVDNGALIVIDVPTASVLARVGSADFFDAESDGQYDACLAPRSPGSTLKPFTYGLAMERHRLYQCEMLLDAPLDYGLYDPENFDKQFHGLVSATEALRESLNVPAISVLERIGGESVHTLLTGAGLTTLTRPPEDYGLGLTLGNCEVRLEELAAAYCMLASLGKYRPLNTIPAPRPAQTTQLLSRGTCLSLYEMLGQPLPEEIARGRLKKVTVAPRVAWKTGTSTGLRDAWAFVFNMHYVVGVWMGNSDGSSSRRLVGAEAALPLAARIFSMLPPSNAPAWPAPETDLREVDVCADTGLPRSRWCRHIDSTVIARRQYLNRVCDVHRPGPPGDAEVAERWPTGGIGWDLANVPEVAGASATRNAPRRPSREALTILSPAHRAEFVLTGEPQGDRIRLQTTRDEATTIHWYLDDQYLGESAPNQSLLLDLTPGDHTVACMTMDGDSRSVRFRVVPPDSTIRFRQ